MIRSMTAFGSARLDSDAGSISAEIRSVNNRYLDLSLRIPEDLRFAESRVRDLVGRQALRGKVELKLSYAAIDREALRPIDAEAVRALAEQLQWARRLIPDLPAPTLAELPREGAMRGGLDAEVWLPLCEQACEQALEEFGATRLREGARLAQAMLGRV